MLNVRLVRDLRGLKEIGDQYIRRYLEKLTLYMAGADGSRTHRRHRVPPNEFEAREAHRDLSAPTPASIYYPSLLSKISLLPSSELIYQNDR